MSEIPKEVLLPVAQIVPVTEAEGPGKRFALWLQGCPLRCPGCCNPQMLPFTGENHKRMPLAEIVDSIAAAVRQGVEGITLLGGEPTAHARVAAPLARQVRSMGLSVMVFSGFTLEDLRAQADAAVDDLLSQTDILVDGPYLRDRPDTRRRWIGSTNQRIFFLSDRYRSDDPCWKRANTLEIHLVEGEVTINGFPAPSAVAQWKHSGEPPA